MKIAVITDTGSDSPVVAALREESADLLVVSARETFESALDKVKAAGSEYIVAADAGAVAVAERLVSQLGLQVRTQGESTLRTDRSQQQRALASFANRAGQSITSATDLEKRVAGGPVALLPRVIGSDDRVQVCRDAADAARIASHITGSGQADLFAVPLFTGSVISVDTVSHEGKHVIADVHEQRLDERDGYLFLRHRIALPGTAELAQQAGVLAAQALDAVGIRYGAAHVQFNVDGENLQVAEVIAAPSFCAVPTDAAYVAYGYSHAHLLVEQILRPQEFIRRIMRQPPRAKLIAAVAPLRVWKDQTLPLIDGLRLVRRLGTFHSVTQLLPQGSEVKAGQVVGYATFIGSDREWVGNSLTVLHEIEDTHSLYIEKLDVVDLSSNLS